MPSIMEAKVRAQHTCTMFRALLYANLRRDSGTVLSPRTTGPGPAKQTCRCMSLTRSEHAMPCQRCVHGQGVCLHHTKRFFIPTARVCVCL